MEVEKLAAVFVRGDDFLIATNWQTEAGFWVSADPVTLLPRSASDSQLGAAVRLALDSSRRGVPNPSDWSEFPSSLLRVANVRSWNALQRAAALCQVEADDAEIRVLPSVNGGTRGDNRGYHSLDELAVVVPVHSSDEELGAVVQSAIGHCR